jgi:hypothetical protein
MKLIIHNNNNNMCEGDNLIIKVTAYWLHDGRSIPGKGRGSDLLNYVKTDSESQPRSCSLVIWDCFSFGKASETSN